MVWGYKNMKQSIGIVRDPNYFEHKTCLNHPESPERLAFVYAMLEQKLFGKILFLDPFLASLEQIELVHSPAYVQLILFSAQRSFTNLTSDTRISAKSCYVSWLAVGGCLRGLEAVLDGQCSICFALVRPPGHHALSKQGGGFCIFNNLAVVATWAQVAYNIKRILIIDWDIHHGNGIQDIFYHDPNIFYLSTHYFQAYPYTGEWEDVGIGRGTGYNMNICLPYDATDADVLTVYREILPQVVEGYDPELILIAAGFDAHKDDPLGSTQLSEIAFTGLGALVRCLGPERGIPLLLSLEGGYNAEALAVSVYCTIKGLLALGSGGEETLVQAKSERGIALVRKARRLHGIYGVWMGGMM